MRLSRLFWLGAAATFVAAALVAIAAILSGDFGGADGKILLSLANLVFAGGAASASLSLRERDGRTLLGTATLVVAAVECAIVLVAVWSASWDGGSSRLVHEAWTAFVVLGALLVSVIAALLARGTRARRLARVASGATLLGALATTLLVYREEGDGWQVAAVLWIVGVLCAALVPLVDRLAAAPPSALSAAGRVLATLGEVELVAVEREAAGDQAIELGLAPGERVVLRRRA